MRLRGTACVLPATCGIALGRILVGVCHVVAAATRAARETAGKEVGGPVITTVVRGGVWVDGISHMPRVRASELLAVKPFPMEQAYDLKR